MIAAVCAWHEHHDRAAGKMNLRLRRGEQIRVARPALVESYAVLTRLPTNLTACLRMMPTRC